MFFTLTKRSLYRITVPILITTLFFSCQKELSIENGSIVVTPPDLTTKVNSSVSGFVTDENDAPVIGATVQVGTNSSTTDKYGYFEAKNVQVVKTAAVVTVSKPGYFKGIKTYPATEGKGAFFRIKLIPKTIVGNIIASAGGTVMLASGLSITLPANGVVNAASNVAYSGTINVAAYQINPDAADYINVVPGDQRGINAEGGMKLLRSFGISAVELTGSSGELLQIAPGKKATLSIPIPASLAGSAPASIPLWYFDESVGLWQEQGSAAKNGSAYTGDVSHFSFWDGALYLNLVYFDCTVTDPAGIPIQNAQVKFSYINYPGSGAYGYTDANGYVGGAIPANEQLLLEIFRHWTCLIPSHSQNISTANANISLGTIIIPASATVTGSLIDCSNNPVTNGCIFIHEDYGYYRYQTTNTGSFTVSAPLCNASSPVTIIGEDLTNFQYGNPISYTLTTGNNNVGNIIACGNTPQEFMYYSINGTNYSLFSPDGWANNYIYAGSPLSNEEIWSGSYSNYNLGAQAGFTQQNIGPNSVQDLVFFKGAPIADSMIVTAPIAVHITEFGNIGGYISGNFSGTVTGTYNPGTNYTVTCNFRAKRNY